MGFGIIMQISKQQLSETTLAIIKLVKKGKTPWEIKNLGYKLETARYWDMKINKPERYQRFIVKQIQRVKNSNAKKK